jgi:hypothetical protein
VASSIATSSPGTCCSFDVLCDRCLEDLFAQLRGVAACRGEVWAMELAKVPHLRALPWPEDSERVLAIARAKIADLSRDERARDRLAGELARWAARWWVSR